jgi:HD-GYP domain-containing protein (c-di-GMP phosphodiesterase class II)
LRFFSPSPSPDISIDWQDKQLGSLARGAYLHDIGKLGVPDGILLKPGPLTPEERKIMQRHSQIGFDLVKDIPFLADATDVVLMHHERFDGSGYPQGLKADAIPLSARIFAIADTLDAVTSERLISALPPSNPRGKSFAAFPERPSIRKS